MLTAILWHSALKHALASKAGTSDTLDGGFRYSSFDISSRMNLSLLIDTRSLDTAVNPNKYKPERGLVNKNQGGYSRYSTAQASDYGNDDMTYDVYF